MSTVFVSPGVLFKHLIHPSALFSHWLQSFSTLLHYLLCHSDCLMNIHFFLFFAQRLCYMSVNDTSPNPRGPELLQLNLATFRRTLIRYILIGSFRHSSKFSTWWKKPSFSCNCEQGRCSTSFF